MGSSAQRRAVRAFRESKAWIDDALEAIDPESLRNVVALASNWAAVFAAVSVSVAIACVGSAWTRPERAGLYRLVSASNVVLAAAIVALLGYCRFRCRAILARREGRSQRISASAARDDDARLRVCANCDTPFPPRYRPSATTHKFKCATCGLAAKRPKLKPREESSSPTNAAVSAISGSGVVRRAAAFSLTEAPAAAAASADRADPVVDAEKKDPTALKRATQRVEAAQRRTRAREEAREREAEAEAERVELRRLVEEARERKAEAALRAVEEERERAHLADLERTRLEDEARKVAEEAEEARRAEAARGLEGGGGGETTFEPRGERAKERGGDGANASGGLSQHPSAGAPSKHPREPPSRASSSSRLAAPAKVIPAPRAPAVARAADPTAGRASAKAAPPRQKKRRPGAEGPARARPASLPLGRGRGSPPDANPAFGGGRVLLHAFIGPRPRPRLGGARRPRPAAASDGADGPRRGRGGAPRARGGRGPPPARGGGVRAVRPARVAVDLRGDDGVPGGYGGGGGGAEREEEEEEREEEEASGGSTAARERRGCRRCRR